MTWKDRLWSVGDASTRVQRAWTVVYALTMLLEALALYGAALVLIDGLSAFYVILAYTGATGFLVLAGVLSLSFTSTGLLRRLIWVKAAMLVLVWTVLILNAPDPYLPGSCADIMTGCIRRDAAGTR